MKRFLALTTSCMLIVAAFCLIRPPGPGSMLAAAELRHTYGSSKYKTVCQDDCGYVSGYGRYCPLPAGITCRLCVVAKGGDYANAQADVLCTGTSKPGKKTGNGNVTCGYGYEGICVWNGTIWICDGVTNSVQCTVSPIIDQVKGDPDYDGPDDP